MAPTTDLIAFYVSLLREDFAPEVRRTIPPLVELERSLIKPRFDAACTRIGQAIPSTEEPEDLQLAIGAAGRLGFPLVMKPKSHLVVGDDRGRIVRDLQELRAVFRPYEVSPGHDSLAERYPELRWPMLQKYVPSARTRVYSISGYKDPDAGIVAALLSCKRRQWPPDTGISTWQTSLNDPEKLRAGLETVDRLVTCGMFELELLEGPTSLLAIDLNPRGFGFMALDIALGNDLPWLWFESTLRPLRAGLNLEPRPVLDCRLAIPHYISRCVNALLGARVEDDCDALEQPARSVSMVGHWSDPVPRILHNLRLFRHPGNLIKPYVRAALEARRLRYSSCRGQS